MKECPTCNRTYADETLTFCMADGSLLSAPYDTEATQRIPTHRTSPPPTEILPHGSLSFQSSPKRSNLKLVYIMVGLLALIAGGGAVALFKSGARDIQPNSSPSNTANQESVADANQKQAATLPAFNNKIGMQFVLIPSGSFLMGSSETDVDAAFADAKLTNSAAQRDKFSVETPQHRVTIKEGFYMGKFEVTQAQWRALMGNNPSHSKNCDNCPVEQVSWYDTQGLINKLNRMNDGYLYRLPSEAEWEYAARAGTTTTFAFGNSLSSSQANFNGNNPFGNAPKDVWLKKTAPVGSYQPNGWGLYDMHGNVYEWVEDICSGSYTGLPVDGSPNMGNGDSVSRVLRGGSWTNHAKYCRSAFRNCVTPDYSYLDSGLRLVAVPKK